MMNFDHFEELVAISEGGVLKGKSLKNCVVMALGDESTIESCRLDACTILEKDGAVLTFSGYVTPTEKGGTRNTTSFDGCPESVKDKLRPQIHALGGVEF